jgi:hypothetical protein
VALHGHARIAHAYTVPLSRGPDTARGARRGRRARCGRGYVACRVREGELCVTTVGSRPESARRQAQLQGRGSARCVIELHIMTCEAHTTLTHMTREERRGAPAAPYRVLTTSRPRETET